MGKHDMEGTAVNRTSPQRNGRRLRHGSTGRSGFTLVEVMIALLLVMAGMAGYMQSILQSSITADSNRRMAIATQRGRAIVEQIKSTDFADAFATFNADPADDPGGAGTAAGATFTAPGLQAALNDADGIVGQILFPVDVAAPGVLRENLPNPVFGTPRDLDGDAAVDALDHSGDYRLLPVVVRLAWRTTKGTARLEFKTVMVDL